MAEHYQGIMKKIGERAPNSSQVLGLVALVILGSISVSLAGLTTACFVLLTPVMILFSPFLIAVGTALFVAVAGFFCAGLLGVAVFGGVSWAYNYVKGRHPPGSDQIVYARMKLGDTANQVKDYARKCGGYLYGKLREAAPEA